MKNTAKKRTMMGILAAGMLLMSSVTVFAADSTTVCPNNPDCIRPADCQYPNQNCQRPNQNRPSGTQTGQGKQYGKQNGKQSITKRNQAAKATAKVTKKTTPKKQGACGNTPKRDGSGRGQGGRRGQGRK